MIDWIARKSVGRVKQMLRAIRSKDYTARLPEENLHGAERELAEEINDIVTEFRKKLLQQERRREQYEVMFDTIDTALMVTDTKGNIHFMNRKAVEGLCGFRINNLSSLDVLQRGFSGILLSLVPGESRLVTINKDGSETQLKISMVRYSVEGEDALLFSIENVNQLLLQNEIDAQRKLVRVLTHEIMNSLSPIISLSKTLYDSSSALDDDTRMALEVIRHRSEGLLAFTENYRRFSQVAEPKFSRVKIGDLLEDLKKLYPAPYISFTVDNSDIMLRMDRDQIMQVLINILKNAIEACDGNPEITVYAKADYPSRRYMISVADNGCGISEESREKIFVPFYTTKSHGSGIGLSLSRQIIGMHGGTLRLESSGNGSKFTLLLPYKV